MKLGTKANPQGRVVVNGVLSSNLTSRKIIDYSVKTHLQKVYQNAPVENATLGLEQGDPVFAYRGLHSKKKKITDSQYEVFSSLNGMYTKAGNLLEKVKDDMHFVGFSATNLDFTPDRNHYMGCVVQMGGILTVKNTGKEVIRTGDYIYWDLPKNASNKKMVAELRPVTHKKAFGKYAFRERILEMLQDRSEGRSSPSLVELEQVFEKVQKIGTANIVEKSQIAGDVLATMYKHFIESYIEDVNYRIVGQAMSDAQPGKPFDILLGQYSI